MLCRSRITSYNVCYTKLLRIYNPRGSVVSEQQLTLNEEGSFETQYQTLSTSQTGQYRFELWTGNNLFLQSYKVSVEDFVPDRLKITLTASREEARPGDKIIYDLQTFNFFGPPAAGRNWEFEASFDIVPFQSKAYPDFRFRITSYNVCYTKLLRGLGRSP